MTTAYNKRKKRIAREKKLILKEQESQRAQAVDLATRKFPPVKYDLTSIKYFNGKGA